MTENTETLAPLLAATDDTLIQLAAKSDALTEYEDSSLWSRFYPREIPFFKLALLNKLQNRSFHAVQLEGPFELKRLLTDYRDQVFRSETNLSDQGEAKVVRLLLQLEADGFAYLENDELKVYAVTAKAAEAAARKFQRYLKAQNFAKPSFMIISMDEFGAHAEPVEMERTAPVTTDELALNYGQDFPAWEQQWLARLQGTSSGLTIFHGPPGCGKTSYLRALMSRLLDKSVFYFVPVSEAELLSDPRFVSFWIKQTKRHPKKHKIVLLEDAEELLLPRDAGSRDKVSNLLNIADGFLGDHLKLHVIATTNATVRKLDAAILRPGRLMGAREFRRLTPEEAQRLAQAKGLTLPDQPDYSLAEIYCGTPAGFSSHRERQVGF